MNRFSLALAAASIGVSFGTVPARAQIPIVDQILPYGTTCADWSRAASAGMQGRAALVPVTTWLLGLTAGFSFGIAEPQRSAPQPEAIRNWMDDYCALHPDTLLVLAGMALLYQLNPQAQAFQHWR